jgi:archaellum biogenesis ATPase FlaH
MPDPIPLCDVDAERALLGSIMIAPDRFMDLVTIVKTEYFYLISHRWIWEAMNHLVQSELQIDFVTLCDALRTSGFLKEMGGAAYIMGLLNVTPTSLHAESYAKIVREKALKRKAIEVATNLAQNAIQDKPLSEALQQMEEFFVSSSALSGITERMVMTAEKLCLAEMGELTWILKDWIMAGGINLIAGMPAAGKSFLALDLAIGMASSGLAWDNRSVTQGNVLYHFLDGSYRGMRSRVLKLCTSRGIQPPANLIFDFSPLNLKVTSEVLALRQRIHRLDASVVIFDVMAKFMPGADENSVAEISPMMNTMREIANQIGTTFILIHHLNKGGNTDLSYRVRGSSDILGSVDTAIVVTHENQHSAHSMRTIIPQKVRESLPPSQLQFQIESTEESIALRFSETNSSEMVRTPGQAELMYADILEYLQSKPAQEFKKNDLTSALQINTSARTIDRVFSKLNIDPRIKISKRGSYNTYQWEEDTPAMPSY